MKKFLLLAAAALLAGVAGMWLGRHFHHSTLSMPTIASGQAVAFSLPDISGHERSVQDWTGKVRIVNFWATWCPPCREEIPEFIKAQRRLGPKGLQIIGIAVDRPSRVVQFYKAKKMNYPVLLGEQQGMQLMTRYGDVEGGLPYSIILDRQGRIVASKLGAFTRASLKKALSPYLQSPS